MAGIVKKSLNQPEEVKIFEKTRAEFVTVGGIKFKRVTVEPGWQWSKHLKPVEGGSSCQRYHLLYVISGKLRVKTDDGKEEEYGPGDVGEILPGHDGWNVGNKPLVWLEILTQK